MVAAGKSSLGERGGKPLVFSGAETANQIKIGKKLSENHLGLTLNLGVDNAYVSDPKSFHETKDVKSNQSQQASDATFIDLTAALVELKKNPAFSLAAFTGKTWNYSNAALMAKLLSNSADNGKGADNEQAALSDFLSVYNVTQNQGAAGAANHDGSYEELGNLVKNAPTSTVIGALFGDGKASTTPREAQLERSTTTASLLVLANWSY